MMLLLPLIIVLMVKLSDARTHSLRYFRLGVSEPGYGIPEFISAGYVDSHPITMYNSVSQLKEPRAPWMAENLAPDHWERYTQLLRGWQQAFKVELKQLQRHYNHSGVHTYQRMIGCELLEDGSTTGFLQYAYDGQDFIIFNKDTLSWIAMDNVGDIIRRAWEANRHELQYQKNWLEEECIAWLKRFLEYGKDPLQRTEPPKVRVSRKETFPGITTLYCRAHGFYPPEISMKWMKNGEEIIQDTEYGGILPSGDGTYQTWVSVELDSQNNDIYSCHVEHGGVHMVLQGSQGLLYAQKIPEDPKELLFIIGNYASGDESCWVHCPHHCPGWSWHPSLAKEAPREKQSHLPFYTRSLMGDGCFPTVSSLGTMASSVPYGLKSTTQSS